MSDNLSEVGYKIIRKRLHKQRNCLLSTNQAGRKSVCCPIKAVFSDFPPVPNLKAKAIVRVQQFFLP